MEALVPQKGVNHTLLYLILYKELFCFFLLCLILIIPSALNGQSLKAGDIAVVRINEDNPDAFSFVTLVDIPTGEKIYFTDEGWNGNSWIGNSEDHMVYTSPGLIAGSVVHIEVTGDGLGFTVTGAGGTMEYAPGYSGFSLASGDQLLVYQSAGGAEPTNPVFITGVHLDDGLTLGGNNPVTGWTNQTYLDGGGKSVSASGVPKGLENGKNCISLFPGFSAQTEKDNVRYDCSKGVTGTRNQLILLICNKDNWLYNDNTRFNENTVCSFTVLPSPEIAISGNGTTITNGDMSPSISDDTEFGNINFEASEVTHTFTITNKGQAPLNLSGDSPYIALTGDTSDFIITAVPSTPITGGGTTTFSIKFDPTEVGLSVTTVSVSSDDPNNSPYTFSIQGTGITTPSVTTEAATTVLAYSANLGGNVTADGANSVTEKGVVYSSTDSTPTIGEPGVIKNENGSGTGSFSKTINSINPGTTYYYQAYTTNSIGTTYGGVLEFTTQNTVSSIVRSDSNPTNSTSINWTLTFAASASGVTSSNFTLTNSGLTGPSITVVNGSGTTWSVTANTGTGSGTLGLNLINDSGLPDGLSNIPFTGEVYTIDKTAPELSSSLPADEATNVTLSRDIFLTFNDYMKSGSGSIYIKRISGDSIFEQIQAGDSRISINGSQVTINPSGTFLKGTSYYIEIDTAAFDDDAENSFAGISGNSTLNFTTVDVVINEIVTDPFFDWSTNGFNGTKGSGSVTQGTDEWVELYIKSSGIDFTNWIIELLDGSDVIGNLTSSGSFDVSRYVGTGSFTNSNFGDYLVLGNVDGNSAINDNATVKLKDPGGAIVDCVALGGGPGKAPDGNSTNAGNESVQRIPNGIDTGNDSDNFVKARASMGFENDNTPPSVVIENPSLSITNSGPVTFTVSYSGADSIKLSVGDITLNSSGTATGTILVDGTGTISRTVTINNITGDGTMGISIKSGTASDRVGYEASAAGPSSVFAVDNTPPSILISPPSVFATKNGPVSYTLTYSGATSMTLDSVDILLNSTGTASGNLSVTVSGLTTRTVTINDITGDGTLSISIDSGTATDDAGNLSGLAGPSFSFQVDDTLPSITCRADTTVYLGNYCEYPIGDLLYRVTASDECGSVTLFQSPSETHFLTRNNETRAITLTAVDCGGNSNSCTFTITGIDTISPKIVCPRDTIVNLDPNCEYSIGDWTSSEIVSDNCGYTKVSQSLSGGSILSWAGNSTVVTLTANDISGNFNSCSFTITAKDTISPAITCQPDTTVFLDSNREYSIGDLRFMAAAMDNCGTVSLSQSLLSGSSILRREDNTRTVILNAEDENGNSRNCTFKITAVDSTPPKAICRDVTIWLDRTGKTTLSPEMVDNGSSDNCNLSAIELSKTIFDCQNIGSNTVSLVVVDSQGNRATCQSMVAVKDTIPPVALCHDTIVWLDKNGVGFITPEMIDKGSSDNCLIVALEINDNGFDCSEIGNNQVTLTATDSENNTSTCFSAVIVRDTFPPAIVCHDTIVFLDRSGLSSVASESLLSDISDNCGIWSVEPDTVIFGCNDIITAPPVPVLPWINEFHYDNAGTDENEFIEIAGPAGLRLEGYSIILYNGGNNKSYKTIKLAGTVPNERGGFGAIVFNVPGIQNGPSDGIALIGPNSVVIEFLSYEGQLTAADGLASGHTSIDVGVSEPADTPVGSSLFLGGDSIWRFTLKASPGLLNPGQAIHLLQGRLINITATDNSGKSSSCESAIAVLDTIASVALCRNVTLFLDQNGEAITTAILVDAGSWDNCAVESLILSRTEFTCIDVGQNPVLLTVTDVSRNLSTCSSIITVKDTIQPKAICRDTTVWLNGNGSANLLTVMVDEGSSDNCILKKVELSKTYFGCQDIGLNTVTMTVSDLYGNIATCQALVNVRDTILPKLLHVKDFLFYFEPGVCESTLDYPNILAQDNCGFKVELVAGLGANGIFTPGIYTEKYRVLDSSGNSDTVSFNITVISRNANPTISFIPDVVVDEDSEVRVELKGISDGGDCSPQDVSITVLQEPLSGITNINVEYSEGDSTALLTANLLPNWNGEEKITIVVNDNEGGKTSRSFLLKVNRVNDPPFLLNPIPDFEVNVAHVLQIPIPRGLGKIFEDPDEGDVLSINLNIPGKAGLPGFMKFSDDTLSIFPMISDTGRVTIIAVASDLKNAIAKDTFDIFIKGYKTSTDIIKEPLSVRMYPNPTKGIINLSVEKQFFKKLEVRIYSAGGQLIMRKNYMSNNIQIDLQNQSDGIYFIHIMIGDSEVIKKFILERD